MDMDKSEIKLISLSEAIKVLSVSRSKLYAMVINRQIPYVKFDRHIKFDVNDLKKFIESKKVSDFQYDFSVLGVKGKKY